ncbi:MAG: T9SS type A sorting domain-containing protein [Saprospiraceae bacterium]|nr:T9SS type A sorting domain-containing protein [Saprospiraceae bacterium]
MERSFFTLVLLLFVLTNQVTSQVRDCYSDQYLQEDLNQNPRRLKIMEEIERHTSMFKHHSDLRSTSVVTIPVVVHILYNEAAENISDEQIRSQIDVLNKDFRRLNSDATTVWPQAVDAGVEFCLASVDPYGKTTSGITRSFTSLSSFASSGDYIKYASKGGKDAWPSDSYLNIWVGDLTGSLLGYAQFPGGKAETDGVVIDYKVFGTGPNVTPGFHLGRTATHEIGHWLNLKHIWGNADCTSDDLVVDTPLADGPNYGCNKGSRSCGSVNMVENYMDYSNDDCMNLFTAGQKTRMLSLFAPGGFRKSITQSKGCGTVPVISEYCEKISVQMTLDNYPQETSWEIKDKKGVVILKSRNYLSTEKNKSVKLDSCLTVGCYDFIINDVYSDGICCKYGQGNYKVYAADKLIAEGGSFGKSAMHSFCIESKTPTCTDGIKNGSETGIDCGGILCLPCPSCTDGIKNGTETNIDCGGPDCPPCVTLPDGTGTSSGTNLTGAFFEQGWDNWTGGATDTERYLGDFSWEGDHSIMIRDNSGEESAITSPEVDIRSFSKIKIDFSFYAYSMEKGEDFFLQYYDGNKWNTLRTYVSETDFYNNNFYEVVYTLDSSTQTFAQKSKFRFMCDASTNADQIYLDAIKITGISADNREKYEPDNISTVGHYLGEIPVFKADLKIFPNPSQDIVHIQSNVEMISYKILDMTGKILIEQDVNDDHTKADISLLESGFYLLNIQTDETIISKRLIRK